MILKQVKGNTWVLDSWELIPLYKLDDRRCVLLDTGVYDQREDIEETLAAAGLSVAGVLCSHAHLDHMGCCAYFQSQGAELAMSLGEVGQIFSPLGIQLQYYNLPKVVFPDYPEIGTAACLPNRIIMPGEEKISFCGAEFEILHTPGHTVDHICVKTPDDVLYLADAMMTGPTLHKSKFPYAFCVQTYLDTLADLRSVEAEKYVVAHKGIYDDILPLIDMELRYFHQRMMELLNLMDDNTTAKELTEVICRTYRVYPGNVRHLAYFEQASQTFLHYLCNIGRMEPAAQGNHIVYRKIPQKKTETKLPPAGQFR